MNAYPKFRYGLSVLAAIFIALSSQAQDSESSEQRAFYLFMSGKVSPGQKAILSSGVLRWEATESGWIQANPQADPESELHAKPLMVISPYFAEIRDLEYSFDSNAEKFRTMMVINEMNAEQMRFEAGNEFEKAVANMDRQGDSVPFTQQDADNIELDELSKDQSKTSFSRQA